MEGQLRDSTRSIPTFFLHNENQSTIKIQISINGSPLRSDGRREPDSVLAYTQDYRSRWTHDDWVDPDSFRTAGEPQT